jgi:hypothetical protein
MSKEKKKPNHSWQCLSQKTRRMGWWRSYFFKKKTKRLFILIYIFKKKKNYLHDIFNHLSHQTKLMTNDSNNILRFTVFVKKIMRFKWLKLVINQLSHQIVR